MGTPLLHQHHMMKVCKSNLRKRLVIIAGAAFMLNLLVSNSAAALSTDRDQPFLVEADSAVVDERAGSTIHRGNVSIDQGSMHIRADEIEVIISEGIVVQIIARTDDSSEQLAQYEQQPDAKERVFAEARKISYFIQEQRIHLSGAARLMQTGDEYMGELVYYDVGKGIVNLKSGADNDDRIKIRYNTKK